MQRPIKLILISYLLGLPLAVSLSAQQQPLRISIQLPAGVGLSTGSVSSEESKIVGESLDFSLITEDGTVVPLTWIRMQSLENSQFLIDLKSASGESFRPFLYFLNDNSDRLERAKPVSAFPSVLQFNEEGKLIRTFFPRRTALYSWLGLPKEEELWVRLEYF
ncbi:hypothetical protein ACFPIK_15440 [Algoriphagus aquatilis]|uniref:Uncharacterized protein n=1 Tax=Algoriphagus aquatilis TaxID=490186 RepID=A0ABW0BYY3_9BACT